MPACQTRSWTDRWEAEVMYGEAKVFLQCYINIKRIDYFDIRLIFNWANVVLIRIQRMRCSTHVGKQIWALVGLYSCTSLCQRWMRMLGSLQMFEVRHDFREPKGIEWASLSVLVNSEGWKEDIIVLLPYWDLPIESPSVWLGVFQRMLLNSLVTFWDFHFPRKN